MSRRPRSKPASIKDQEVSDRGSRINLGTKGQTGESGYHSENYPHSERVRVEFEDDAFVDSIKGLNRGHALSRAAANWPNAKRIVALGGKVVRKAAKLMEGSGAMGPPDVRESTRRTMRKPGDFGGAGR